MDQAITKLINAIIADYPDNNREMADHFSQSILVKPGKKYIKIIADGSVWGFVVNVHDDEKFKYGDILKPASWAAPARNRARGNVFGEYKINWTGPNYLK